MLISRWQAPLSPTKEQLGVLLSAEGLEPYFESYSANEKISEHRHPFAEVRVIVEGELLVNVTGNQFLLRPGDRLEIPANTKHWHVPHGQNGCVCICAQRVI